jgi:hypothetical protein
MVIISAEWGWGFRDVGRNYEKEGVKAKKGERGEED